jgi:predicted nucleic acid-binding protein
MASSGLVVDASVIVKWFLRDEPLFTEAASVFADWTAGRWSLSGPGHLPFEVTGAILRAERSGRLPRLESQAAIDSFAPLAERVIIASPASIIAGASRLALSLNVGFFDACYLQVARDLGVRLLTADEAFYRQTRAQPDVMWLGDYLAATRSATAHGDARLKRGW